MQYKKIFKYGVISALSIATLFYGVFLYFLYKIDPDHLVLYAGSENNSFLSSHAFIALKLSTKSGPDESPHLLQFTLNTLDLDGYDKSKIFDIFQMLREKGHDLNELSYYGWTTLHNAVITNDPELVSYLLKNGANPDIKTKIKGSLMNKELSKFNMSGNEKIDNMTALELAQYLQQKEDNNKYSEVIDLLKKSNKSLQPTARGGG